MSGICGVVRSSGETASARDLEPLLQVLAQRGPHGFGRWIGGPAALGHSLLATTCEAAAEQMPLIDSDSGMVITGDIRLDNREELIAALRLRKHCGDGEVALRAYQRWGAECPGRLLGDFAFAIWDPREQTLIAARDPAAMRPLCFAIPKPDTLVFASEAVAVGEHHAVERRLNEERFADLFDEMEALDLDATLLIGVSRLRPGHVLRFSQSGLNIRPFAVPFVAPPHFKRDQDYVDAFRDCLAQAVAARLRSNNPVAAMLSGGLDSASVCALAACQLQEQGSEPLATYSVTGPDPDSKAEALRVSIATTTIANIRPRLLDYSVAEATCGQAEALSRVPDLFDASMTLPRLIYCAASSQGHRVVLDGVGADVVLSHGYRIRDLLLAGRFGAAIAEARGEAAFWNDGQGTLARLVPSAVQAWAPKSLRKARRVWRWRRADNQRYWHAPLSLEFAHHVKLRERRKAYREIYESDAPVPVNAAGIDPFVLVARERYERAAAAMGVEARDPFLDRRFVEFCSGLPAHLRQCRGWPKVILRLAMADDLPDALRWGRGKPHFGLAASEHLIGVLALASQADTALSGMLCAEPAAARSVLDLRRESVLRTMAYCCLRDSALLPGEY